MISCNGSDTFAVDAPWAIFGRDSAQGDETSSPFIVHMIGCNLEGCRRPLVLRYGGHLTMESCLIQAWLVGTQQSAIIDTGYLTKVTVINCSIQSITAVAMDSIINSTIGQTGGNYLLIGTYDEAISKVKYTNGVGGTNILGTGILPPIPQIGNCSIPKPATVCQKLTSTSVDTLFIGHASGSPQIMAGTGSPEGLIAAARGSIFLRTDGAGATTLYVKTTGDLSTNTGWVAK